MGGQFYYTDVAVDRSADTPTSAQTECVVFAGVVREKPLLYVHVTGTKLKSFFDRCRDY